MLRELTVNPLARFRVADVMEKRVIGLPASMSIDVLFRRLMNDRELGRARAWPLVEDDGALVGILTGVLWLVVWPFERLLMGLGVRSVTGWSAIVAGWFMAVLRSWKYFDAPDATAPDERGPK